VSASAWPCCAAASVWWTVPVRVMLPRPVIEDPGYTPRSPLIVVAPVLVTVEAPNTLKLCAEPNMDADADAVAQSAKGTNAMNPRASPRTMYCLPKCHFAPRPNQLI